ncbi:MAG TPA: acyl carrier protein [Legionellaceae bacterium]|nr:acyl carrier protein [Legionellaceae bacterium]
MKMEELINLVNGTLPEAKVLSANTDLVDDLGFDSLKYIDLVVMLENEYGIVIEEEKLAKIKTIKQLHDACLDYI